MIRFLVLAFFSSIFCLCGGCATLVRGDSQKVDFVTDPAGATVNVNGTAYISPTIVTMKRKQAYTITIWAPGYQAIKFELKSSWDGASIGDLLMPGGSVLVAVDTVVGSDRSFNKMATIKLARMTGSSTQPVTMYQYRGKILAEPEYRKAVKELEAYHARRSD
ncbi:MAG TPA: hypothetical protein VHD56_14570 [Tepidisphaeraceae bacterium]|nr:hypothetical protein [Tepidisphaeraceae bacterium]